MRNFFIDLHELIADRRNAVIARIVYQEGSAPRSIGTKCIILENGVILGTIGGGALEYGVVEKAREVLKQGKSDILHFQLTGEDVAKTDMLCGGIVDVFLEPISSENEVTVEIFAETRKLVMEGYSGTLLTLIAEGIDRDERTGRVLVVNDGTGIKIYGKMPEGVDIDAAVFLDVKKPELKAEPGSGSSIFIEPIEAADVLYIFGAGHISTFLSPLAKKVGFGVVVIDDRSEFANHERFPDADEIHVLPFSRAFHEIKITASSYIAIITRGHIHDHEVLRAALGCQSAYIGMVGSRRKREMIYRSLISEGVQKEALDRVHSPIGLDIGAETPEEIAVSIVAELIEERASRKV